MSSIKYKAIKKITDKVKYKLKKTVVVTLLLTFILPYYAMAATDKEKGRGAVPATAGTVLQGITTVTDAANSASIGSISTNYPQTGDGYNSLTEINGRQYKNYKQYLGSYSTNSYWGGTVSNNGCGPTSIAIIASGYGIDKNPGEICNIIKTKYGNYTGSSTLSSALNDLGISYSTKVGDNTSTQIKNIKENLEKGNPVAVGVNGGTGYSPGGHWMAALGMEGDQIVISNPGNGNEAVKENLEAFVTRCMQNCSYILITQSWTNTSSSSGKGSDASHNLATEGYTNIHKSSVTGKEFKEYKQSDAPWSSTSYANGNTIGAWGCPLVSDAILCTGYGHDVTPVAINSKYYGGYIVGAEISSITGASTNFETMNIDKFKQHLLSGGTAIVYSHNSKFTGSEHYMAIIDISSDGNEVYLSNPNSAGPNGWMDTNDTLNRMVSAMYVNAGGGSGSYGTGITSLDNFLFIGDSRYASIDAQITALGNNIKNQGVGSARIDEWLKVANNGGTGTVQSTNVNITGKYSGISIQLGANSVLNNVNNATKDMKDFLTKLKELHPGTPIFVNSCLSVNANATSSGYTWNVTTMKDCIKSFDNNISSFCSSTSDIYFVDISKGLEDENGFVKLEYESDGLHCNSKGAAIFAQNIKDEILNCSASTGSTTGYSIGNLTSNISQYIKPNDRGGYKIDIDLDEKVDEMLALLKEAGNNDVNNFMKNTNQKDLLKAMLKAELVTQFPDLRSASEISASTTDEINLQSIKENLPEIINKLDLITVSSVVPTEEQIDFKEFETVDDLNAELEQRFKDIEGETSQDSEKTIFTYSEQGKKFRLEITGTSYNLYEIIDNGDTQAVEEYVFNSLKNKAVQEKIRKIISSNTITREVVKEQFYTTLNSVSRSRGYNVDQMVSLYFSYIEKILNGLTAQNSGLLDWLKSRIVNNMPEDELQGVIRIKRKSINTTTGKEETPIYLSYIPYDEFTKKCNNGDKTVLDHFTINSSGGVIVAQWETKSYSQNDISSIKDAEDLIKKYQSLITASSSYTITPSSPISYLSQIYQHTMPFDLLWTLLIYGGSPDFIYDLTNLIYDTEITITALDKISQTSQTFTKNIGKSDKSVNQGTSSEGGTKQQENKSSSEKTITYTIYTTTCTSQLKVSYINSWIATYINNNEVLEEPETEDSSEHVHNTDEETDWEQTGTEALSEDDAFWIILTGNVKDAVAGYNNSGIGSFVLGRAKKIISENEEIINAYIEHLLDEKVVVYPSDKLKGVTRNTSYTLTQLDNRTNKAIEEIIQSIASTQTRNQIKDAIEKVLIGIYQKVNWDPSVSSGNTTKYTKIDNVETDVNTKTTIYKFSSTSGQIISKTDPNSTEDNFVTLLNKNGGAKGSFRSIDDWLFESIEKNRILCDKLDLIKYLFGIVFNRTYTIDESFSFEMFDPEKIQIASSGGMNGKVSTNLEEFLITMEGGDQYIKGDSYIVYDIGDGCLNIGHGIVVGSSNGTPWYPDILPSIYAGQIVSKEIYDKIYEKVMKVFTDSLDASLAKYNVTLKQYQYDAMISFLYNCGSGKSDIIVLAYKNGGDQGYWNETSQYINKGSAFEYGLRRRRAEEYELFTTGDYNYDPDF